MVMETVALFIVSTVLFIGACARVSLVSAVYLCLWLALCMCPTSNKRYAYVVVLLTVVASAVACLGQIIFQIVLATQKPYGHVVADSAHLAAVWKQIGYTTLNDSDWYLALWQVIVDPVVLIVCAAFLKVFSPAYKAAPRRALPSFIRRAVYAFWYGGLALTCCLLILGTGYPSAFSLVYLLCCFILMMAWAFATDSAPVVATVTPVVAFLGSAHVLLLLLFQFGFIHENMDTNVQTTLGIPAYFNSSSVVSNGPGLALERQPWTVWLYGAMVFVTIFIATAPRRSDPKQFLAGPRTRQHSRRPAGAESSLTEPLLAATIDPITAHAESPSTPQKMNPARADSVETASLQTSSDTLSDFSAMSHNMTWGLYIATRLTKFGRWLTALAVRNSWVVSVTAQYLWALAFPSWFGIAMVVWATLAVLPSTPTLYLKTTPFLAVFALGIACLESLYYFPSKIFPDSNVWTYLGFKNDTTLDHASLNIGLKAILLAAICLSARYRDEKHRKNASDARRRKRRRRHKMSFCFKAWRYTKLYVQLGWFWLLEYLFVVTELIVYITALVEVNLFNAGYLLLLLVFLVSKVARERFWVILVAYCNCVILINYLWGFPIHPNANKEIEQLFGLESNNLDNLWVSLKWHIAILALSTVQLVGFRSLSWVRSATADTKSAITQFKADMARIKQQKAHAFPQTSANVVHDAAQGAEPSTAVRDASKEATSPTLPRAQQLSSFPPSSPATSKAMASSDLQCASADGDANGTPDVVAHDDSGSHYSSVLRSLVQVFCFLWPMGCVLTLGLVGGLGGFNLLRFGYILFTLFLLLAFNSASMLRLTWLLTIIYTSAVLIFQYSFQFEPFRNALKLTKEWQDDIGLEVRTSQLGLFKYLVPPTAIIIMFVAQIKFADLRTSFPLFNPLSTSVVYKAIRFFGRLAFLTKNTVARLVVVGACLYPHPEAIDVPAVILLGTSLIPYGQNISFWLLLGYLEALALAKVVFVLNFVQENLHFTPVDLEWGGFNTYQNKNPAFYFRYELVAILILTCRRFLQSIKSELWPQADPGSKLFLFDTADTVAVQDGVVQPHADDGSLANGISLTSSRRDSSSHDDAGAVGAWMVAGVDKTVFNTDDIVLERRSKAALICFLMNHFAHIFSPFICHVLYIAVALIHLNAISLLFMVFAFLLVPRNSQAKAFTWGVFIALQGVLLLYQFLSALGLPPSYSDKYPWERLLEKDLSKVVIRWFYLAPIYYDPAQGGIPRQPESWSQRNVLFADFVLLFAVNLAYSSARNLNQAKFHTRLESLRHRAKDTLESLYTVLLWVMPWLCLLFLFLIVISRRSAFCLGYYTAGCFLLIKFTKFFTNVELALQFWKRLINYTLSVLMIHILWVLPALLIKWNKVTLTQSDGESDATSGVLLALQFFGLRYSSNVPLLPDDKRFSVWSPGGLLFDVLMCFVAIMYRALLLNTDIANAIAVQFEESVAVRAEAAKTIGPRMLQQVAARKQEQFEAVQEAKKALAKLTERRNRGVGVDRETALWFSQTTLLTKRVQGQDRAVMEADGDTVEEQAINTTTNDFDRVSVEGDELASMGDALLPTQLGVEEAVASRDAATVPAAVEGLRQRGSTQRHHPQPKVSSTVTKAQPVNAAGDQVRAQDNVFSDSDSNSGDKEDSTSSQSSSTCGWLVAQYHWMISAIACRLRVSNEIFAPLWPEFEYEENVSLGRELTRYCLTHAHIICYIFLITNAIVDPSLIVIFLPVLYFVWGGLTRPFPSRRFWNFLIYYSLVSLIVRYFFQFTFWGKFNAPPVDDCGTSFFREDCASFARFMGIWRFTDEPLFLKQLVPDILLLLSLFVQRLCLNYLGLEKMDAQSFFKSDEDKEQEVSRLPFQYDEEGALEGGIMTPQRSFDVYESEDDEDGVEHEMERGEKIEGVDLYDDPDLDEAATMLGDGPPPPSLWAAPKRFFLRLVSSDFAAPVDYYMLSFLVEFVSFLVVCFGWSAFRPTTEADTTATDIISQNRVPTSLLIYLLLQFLFIVTDRCLYLTRSLVGKVIYHYAMVFLIHFVVFYWIPVSTKRSFNQNPVVVFLYLLKVAFLFLSASQIQSTYPASVQRNALTRHTTLSGYLVYVVYRAIPFLFELRMLLDWTCTPTTLSLNDWLRLEDISSQLYVNKYTLKSEAAVEREDDRRQPLKTKLLTGALLVVGLILVLWSPLLAMSVVNQQAEPYVPTLAEVSVGINSFEPLFTMNTIPNRTLTQNEFNELESLQGPILEYEPTDVQRILLSPNSRTIWTISPTSLDQLIKVANSSDEVEMAFHITAKFVRPPSSMATATISTSFVTPATKANRESVLATLLQDSVTMPLENISFPIFYKLPNHGAPAGSVDQFQGNISCDITRSEQNGSNWWTVNQLSPHQLPEPPNRDGWIEIYTFSDRTVPESLSFISSYGIVGLYISVVLVIGQLLRLWTANISHQIVFEKMPQVVTLQNVVEAIYLAREQRELPTEEEFFELLVALYRSPAALVAWSDTDLIEAQ
eukprot:m.80388 g.80388  ORF g.80388 m.80388 type:complete len:2509 (+) comp12598_c0_seq3:623-8149(+)